MPLANAKVGIDFIPAKLSAKKYGFYPTFSQRDTVFDSL